MRLAGIASALFLCLASSAAAAPTYTQVPAAGGSNPVDVAAAPDGSIWYVGDPGKSLARISAGGTLSDFGDVRDNPAGIAPGPGDTMWVAQPSGEGTITKVSAAGVQTEWRPPTGKSAPVALVEGPDGNMWFTASAKGGAIGRITPTGTITEFRAGLSVDSMPWGITAGADGNLWFTEKAGRIGRITPQGLVTEFSAGLSAGAQPTHITAGPDGNLWFTINGTTPAIGRITPQGAITQFTAGLSPGTLLDDITAGRDGRVWFTTRGAAAYVASITPSGTITEYGFGSGQSPLGITSGADGRIVVAEKETSSLGRISVAPGVAAVDTSDVSDSSAALSVAIRPNSEATTYTFEYGTTTAYGSVTPQGNAGSGAGPVSGTAVLGGLAPNTTYHVRAVATNATGTTYGPDHTFTTPLPGAPIATTGAAASVTAESATIDATVNPLTAATSYHFEWGPTGAYGSSLPVPDATLPGDSADHAVDVDLSGLEPNTTYYYRVVAVSLGGTTYGAQESFHTDHAPPAVTTDPAGGVTGSAATLNASVGTRNSGTAWRFEWGTTPAYGSAGPDPDAALAGGAGAQVVSHTVTGLEPNTSYHFRAVGTTLGGTTTGADRTFTTAAVAPDATTGAATLLSGAAARVEASVNPRNSNTRYQFQWGTTDAYGEDAPSAFVPVGSDNGDHAVSEVVGGLELGTTYHYRVVATSAAGVAYGADQTFTTPAPPPADPPPAAPLPELGSTVVVTPAKGVVRVRPPGARRFSRLATGAAVPVGSKVDTRAGRIRLASALPSGRTQRGTFWNGVFTVRQPKGRRGRVDLHVRSPRGCGPREAGAVSAARKRRNGLWGRDRHGRFRTRGRDAVATVRGTKWYTEVRCDGTLARVAQGAVVVRDLHRHVKRVLRAGDRYFARRR